MNVLFLIAAAVLISALVLMCWCITHAPDGHEDASGFYVDARQGPARDQGHVSMKAKQMPNPHLVVDQHLPVA